MSKKLLAVIMLIMALMVIGFSTAHAEYRDDDGQLALQLSPPTTGNPLDHYVVQYNVNGDSVITIDVPNVADQPVTDSTVVLVDKGQWTVASVWAISTLHDTSSVVVSDTAYYADPTGIGPPSVMWK